MEQAGLGAVGVRIGRKAAGSGGALPFGLDGEGGCGDPEALASDGGAAGTGQACWGQDGGGSGPISKPRGVCPLSIRTVCHLEKYRVINVILHV